MPITRLRAGEVRARAAPPSAVAGDATLLVGKAAGRLDGQHLRAKTVCRLCLRANLDWSEIVTVREKQVLPMSHESLELERIKKTCSGTLQPTEGCEKSRKKLL